MCRTFYSSLHELHDEIWHLSGQQKVWPGLPASRCVLAPLAAEDCCRQVVRYVACTTQRPSIFLARHDHCSMHIGFLAGPGSP